MKAWALAFVRSVLLVVALAGGAVAPAYAYLASGPSHVCHCESRGGHALCACSICFPELRSFEDSLAGSTAKGQCGDEDPIWRTISDPAVPAAVRVVIATPVVIVVSLVAEQAPSRWNDRPDPRPPRGLLAV